MPFQMRYIPVLASFESYDELIKKYKNMTESCLWILYDTEMNCGEGATTSRRQAYKP
ncbi:hypothetical protein F511_19283 [Dorcoceras hygrometricum]|uniref:Uncharacterized protein n=1 Tax=Dorcoceras hygrometricum TaxID=472368 RepID=A0A2Z7AEA1_9LAMI|nr:hypothetical protein F511_19283 [Dorcoceras hygrometricum]